MVFLAKPLDIISLDGSPSMDAGGEVMLSTEDAQSVAAALPAMEKIAAAVGEGAAAEWVAARDMMKKMPSIDGIRLHPDKAEIPEEPAVQFAVATAMSMTATDDSFPRDMEYVSRMPKEFQMVYVTDTLRLNPTLVQTKDFIDWSIKNKDIFMGGN